MPTLYKERYPTRTRRRAARRQSCGLRSSIPQSEIRIPQSPNPVPGDPRAFVCTKQKGDSVQFDWIAPEAGSGGPVRSYVIERREYPQSGPPSDWHQAAISIATEALLTAQPRGVQLEYQVLAINSAGAGNPSAIQAVVL